MDLHVVAPRCDFPLFQVFDLGLGFRVGDCDLYK